MNDLEITPRKLQGETDLQKFIRIFEPSKFKQLQNGIEIRGVGDMHRATDKASALIKYHSLALTVVNSGEMAAYKAFEIREETT